MESEEKWENSASTWALLSSIVEFLSFSKGLYFARFFFFSVIGVYTFLLIPGLLECLKILLKHKEKLCYQELRKIVREKDCSSEFEKQELISLTKDGV
jgi:hypothetical protein